VTSWIGGSDGFDFIVDCPFGRHHHTAGIWDEELTAKFQTALSIELAIVRCVVLDTGLLSKINAGLPSWARHVNDSTAADGGSGIGLFEPR